MTGVRSFSLLVRSLRGLTPLALVVGAWSATADTPAKPLVPAPAALQGFLKNTCTECHDAETKKGNLDLTALSFDLSDRQAQARWVKVYDRLAAGEMPPAKKTRPDATAAKAFLAGLAQPLIAADLKREQSEGRSTWRRLNRLEYENAVRELLGTPWLQLKSFLPEDGEAHRFNKIGDALDISHVQMAQYLAAAESALDQVLGTQVEQPKNKIEREYARAQPSLTKKFYFNEFNRSPERATFPVLDFAGQPAIRADEKAKITVGDQDPATREREAVGVVAGAYEPIEPKFSKFTAEHSGRYKLRLNAYSIWVGPGKEPIDKKNPDKGMKWWKPDLDTVSKGRRSEPVTISAEMPPRQIRGLGTIDAGIEPAAHELDVYLLKGETIRVDAARLFRSRPPNFRNPLAEPDGQPGVAFRWLEVEGPLLDAWPTAGQQVIAGDLPLQKTKDAQSPIAIEPRDAAADARRLLSDFMARAYRRPVQPAELERYLGVVTQALKDGNSFTESLFAGYAGVLCSPGFICLEEKPGRLDDRALASRLSFFLWNSSPDNELRALAEQGKLKNPDILRAQSERLLSDPRAQQFLDAFLDYWLDLRKMDATSPDAELYPDYYLDDWLTESAVQETRAFVTHLVKQDLPARNLINSDFAFVNERLAAHYGLPKVEGAALRKVTLPPNSSRGGLMTQASVLKVTANGTTTSPVLRGVWILERILGTPPPPPPPAVPAVEPDIRGAKTIREQLEKHRNVESCNACHKLIDPPGFALEQFDILGAERTRYRATGDGGKPPVGWGKNGQPFAFHEALPVDASGALPTGQPFANVGEFKQLLLKDERAIARNVVQQLVAYGTGAAVRFGDRQRVEEILDRASASHYGMRSLIHALVQSSLFQNK
jgi:Protein of unknown function (DUF1592)/Protein of unknown function (DUF1588)/Protein of unknown function (DUF1587)/Protein of unknown function (DUF1585)/Protein of unknown function (DUF1595)/Planctomycete cytochrome C